MKLRMEMKAAVEAETKAMAMAKVTAKAELAEQAGPTQAISAAATRAARLLMVYDS
jgi:hypothetical protein